jgi:hypothetical protein
MLEMRNNIGLFNTGDISGSHGGEYEDDDCLLGCCAV